MTEVEWNSCTDPVMMVEWLRTRAQVNERKVRLFVAACARILTPAFGDGQESVALAHERHADGQMSDEDLVRFLMGSMFEPVWPDNTVTPRPKLQPVWESACIAARTAADFSHLDCRPNTEAENGRVCHLLRDIVGNPLSTLQHRTFSCLTPAVIQLAQEIYEHRSFERTRELADALEATGCTDSEVLGHLRLPGLHWRGCWAVDVVLGRT